MYLTRQCYDKTKSFNVQLFKYLVIQAKYLTLIKWAWGGAKKPKPTPSHSKVWEKNLTSFPPHHLCAIGKNYHLHESSDIS